MWLIFNEIYFNKMILFYLIFLLNLFYKENYEKQMQDLEDENEKCINEISKLEKSMEKLRNEISDLKSKVTISIYHFNWLNFLTQQLSENDTFYK